MKDILHILFLFLFINILIFLNIYSFKNSDFIVPILNINTDTSDNYDLIIKVLNDSNMNDLIPFIDYISIKKIDKLNINKTIYILSLPENKSIVSIYSDSNKYLASINDLDFIKDLYFHDDFLIIEQNFYDNSSSKDFIEVYNYNNFTYELVFSKNIYSELISNDTSGISKTIINCSIDFVDSKIPTIICISSITFHKGFFSNLKNDYEFIESKHSIKKEIYEWNTNLNSFTLNKST